MGDAKLFRRAYIQIATWLTVSTLCLLCCLGFGLYAELARQLRHSGQDKLQSSVPILQDRIRDVMEKDHHSRRLDLADMADDTGRSVYFVLLEHNETRATSKHVPVPISTLQQETRGRDGFVEFDFHQVPYRLFQTHWDDNHQDMVILLVTQISNERETIQRLLVLLCLAGGFGLLLAIAINLWMAHRALRPARQTWIAHHDMLLALSHELQTPLATIKAIADLSIEDPSGKERLLSEVGHASEIVKNMLYLSRLRSVPPHHEDVEPVAVSDITEEVTERFLELCEKRDIHLNGRADAGLYVNTTTEKWSQLVSTLLKNVVDHAQPATLATWCLEGRGDRVVFFVENRRHRPAREGKPNPISEGLGLTIARKLVEDMGGMFALTQSHETVQVRVSVPRLRI